MTHWDRFLSKVYAPDGAACWMWLGYKTPAGYGLTSVNDKTVSTHRWGYEMMVGTIPEGLELDHLCRNRLCVNPLHLEPVTPYENLLRSSAWDSPHGAALDNSKKTHCPRGHPYDFVCKGARRCRRCTRKAKADYKSRKRTT